MGLWASLVLFGDHFLGNSWVNSGWARAIDISVRYTSVTQGRFDYLLVESTGLSEPLPGAEPRLGRRTVLTFPLLPPPQKN